MYPVVSFHKLNGGVGDFFLSHFWLGKEVMAILRQRAGDEKTNVRKSALQVRWVFHVLPSDYPECCYAK